MAEFYWDTAEYYWDTAEYYLGHGALYWAMEHPVAPLGTPMGHLLHPLLVHIGVTGADPARPISARAHYF